MLWFDEIVLLVAWVRFLGHGVVQLTVVCLEPLIQWVNSVLYLAYDWVK